MYNEASASTGPGQPSDHFKQQDLKTRLPQMGKPVRERDKI